MYKKVTCRRCKENPSTWEIQDSNGYVRQQHYSSKDECVKAAKKISEEYGAELCIEENLNNTNNN